MKKIIQCHASESWYPENKKPSRFILFMIIIYFFSPLLLAADDYYPFKTQQQQIQFQALTSQLRCLVCQNQNIAESNAPLASDLRHEIYLKIQSGQSNSDIVNYLVNRYGDYILYNPPFNWHTLGLWLGPFLFLIIAIGVLFFHLRKQQEIC